MNNIENIGIGTDDNFKPFSRERILRGPNQVLSLGQIEVGRAYIERHKNDEVGREFSTSMVIVGEPQVIDGSSWVRISVEGVEWDASLADMGVIPYESGVWNPANWLEAIPEDSAQA